MLGKKHSPHAMPLHMGFRGHQRNCASPELERELDHQLSGCRHGIEPSGPVTAMVATSLDNASVGGPVARKAQQRRQDFKPKCNVKCQFGAEAQRAA